MKVLTCEICGSTDLIKEDGVFVCKSCSTKYSVEEAKKLLVDSAVEITGTVKIDTSSELTNLYEIARRAKETDNNDNGLKYYDMILVKDPGSWEANFYVVYFKAMVCKIAEIQSAAISVDNCIESVLTLVEKNVLDKQEQQEVINELYMRIASISEMLYTASGNHYNDIDISIRNEFAQEYVYNVFSCKDIMYTFGDCLVSVFGDTYGTTAAEAWKKGIEMHNGFMSFLDDKELNKQTIMEYSEKVKKYDKTYQSPNVNTSSGGCYIATSVYGSYDCAEVWTLRRFRDDTLAETWYGRLFIVVYYAISPSFVEWFGNTGWFKKMWRFPLDKIVKKLHESGVDSTPYQDKKK